MTIPIRSFDRCANDFDCIEIEIEFIVVSSRRPTRRETTGDGRRTTKNRVARRRGRGPASARALVSRAPHVRPALAPAWTTRSRVAPRAPAARRARVSRGRDAASSRVRRRGRATVVARGATHESSLSLSSPLVASSRSVRPSVRRLARASARRVDESRSAHRVVRTLDGVAPRARVESSSRVDRVERARDRVGRSVGRSIHHIRLFSVRHGVRVRALERPASPRADDD